MRRKAIKFVVLFAALVIAGFFIGKYFLEHRVGYGAISYVNTNIPDGFVFTNEGEVPESFRVAEDYHGIQQVGGMFSEEFYCQELGRNADLVTYWEHRPGYDITGWSYGFAVVCGDDYLIVHNADYLGEAIYGPFSLKNTE